MSTAELASSYAALILADDGVEVTVCPGRLEMKRGYFWKRRKATATKDDMEYGM